MTTYESDNIFSKILKGGIPSHNVYEDDDTYAFMDVMPQSDGHVLVIPKTGSRNILDAKPETLQALILKVQLLAKAVKTAMNADGIRIAQFNETSAGQTVFHLHFHIIPTYENVVLRAHTGEMANNDLLAKHAEKIRSAVSS